MWNRAAFDASEEAVQDLAPILYGCAVVAQRGDFNIERLVDGQIDGMLGHNESTIVMCANAQPHAHILPRRRWNCSRFYGEDRVDGPDAGTAVARVVGSGAELLPQRRRLVVATGLVEQFGQCTGALSRRRRARAEFLSPNRNCLAKRPASYCSNGFTRGTWALT